MKYPATIILALTVGGCANWAAPQRAPRPMTLGDCMFQRGHASFGVIEGVGGAYVDYYAIQSCEAELRRNNGTK